MRSMVASMRLGSPRFLLSISTRSLDACGKPERKGGTAEDGGLVGLGGLLGGSYAGVPTPLHAWELGRCLVEGPFLRVILALSKLE